MLLRNDRQGGCRQVQPQWDVQVSSPSLVVLAYLNKCSLRFEMSVDDDSRKLSNCKVFVQSQFEPVEYFPAPKRLDRFAADWRKAEAMRPVHLVSKAPA